MTHSIKLLKAPVTYTLTRKASIRSIRLAVYPGGDVVVTTPHTTPLTTVELFLKRKAPWLVAHIDRLKGKPRVSYPKASRMEYAHYKTRALTLVRERLAHFNTTYGFSYTKVTIRNQRRRWGSCSSKGSLSFNYRIALLPEHLADYIIVHELCHRKEMNHAAHFWSLVAQTIPHHQAYRAELKKYTLS